MKVFLSVPMKGRTKENIEKTIEGLKRLASALYPGAECVNTIVEEKPPYELDPNHNAIWYLGKSIQILSQCDAFICVDNSWSFRGCEIENHVANLYGLQVFRAPALIFAPDLIKHCDCDCASEDALCCGENRLEY